ncbi:hypothetical protein BD770DRAFT_403731, partial [Pilaira anomala]
MFIYYNGFNTPILILSPDFIIYWLKKKRFFLIIRHSCCVLLLNIMCFCVCVCVRFTGFLFMYKILAFFLEFFYM